MELLECKNLSKFYDKKEALKDVNLKLVVYLICPRFSK